MANNLKNTIFLEFYGLPGSGKSKVSHLLASSLIGQGYPVVEPSYQLDHNETKLKRVIHKALIILWFICSAPSTYRKAFRMAQENGYKGVQKILQGGNILQKVKEYQKQRAVSTIVIWDQGVTQAAISLSATKRKEAKDNEQLLYDLCATPHLVVKIYMRTTITQALKHMMHRHNHDSRVEKEPDPQKRQEMMQQIYEDCERITNQEVVVVDGADTPEKLAQKTEQIIKDCYLSHANNN